MTGHKRLSLKAVRKLARATVVQAWSVLAATRAQVDSAQARVKAAEFAFESVRREFGAGQRSTFELLTVQQAVLNARIALVMTQRERVTSSYALLAAVGRLAPGVLGLPTESYDPSVHIIRSGIPGSGCARLMAADAVSDCTSLRTHGRSYLLRSQLGALG